MPPKETARERAEQALNHKLQSAGSHGAAMAGRRIGWALLDVADAVRDLADATRERRRHFPRRRP